MKNIFRYEFNGNKFTFRRESSHYIVVMPLDLRVFVFNEIQAKIIYKRMVELKSLPEIVNELFNSSYQDATKIVNSFIKLYSDLIT